MNTSVEIQMEVDETRSAITLAESELEHSKGLLDVETKPRLQAMIRQDIAALELYLDRLQRKLDELTDDRHPEPEDDSDESPASYGWVFGERSLLRIARVA